MSSTYGFSSEKIGTNHVTRRSEDAVEIIDQSRPSRLGGRFLHSLVDGLLQEPEVVGFELSLVQAVHVEDVAQHVSARVLLARGFARQ